MTKLEVSVISFAAGLLTGILCFSSPSDIAFHPSSEAISIYRGGFLLDTNEGADRVPNSLLSAPATPIGLSCGVRSGPREAPPTHHPSGLPNHQSGLVPDMFSPGRADESPADPGMSALSINHKAHFEGKCISRLAEFDSKQTVHIIRKAAERNGIEVGSDNWFILLAIRKQENGGPGKEFGVKGKAWGTDLDTQAAESACTVVKNRKRWVEAGRPGMFIEFLADRYCPRKDDPVGNFNWKKNVRFWFSKFKEI